MQSVSYKYCGWLYLLSSCITIKIAENIYIFFAYIAKLYD